MYSHQHLISRYLSSQDPRWDPWASAAAFRFALRTSSDRATRFLRNRFTGPGNRQGQQNSQYQIGTELIRPYHSRPKPTAHIQPLQQLLRSPGAFVPFAPVPLTERRTTLRTERLSWPGERLRQGHCHQGRDWWGWCCASLHWPRPAMRKMWYLQRKIEENAFRGSKTRASTPASEILFDLRMRLVRVLLCCKASANACDVQTVKSTGNQESPFEKYPGPQHRCHQSYCHGGRGIWEWCSPSASQPMPAEKGNLTLKLHKSFFSAKRNFEKQKGLCTSVSNLITWQVDPGDDAVDLQGFRQGLCPSHHLSPRTRLRCERRSRSQKNCGGLDCGAQTTVKVELGGSAVFFQLLGEVLFGCHGAGAEETRSVVGDFLQKGFSLLIFGDVLFFHGKMKPIWIEICIELIIVSTKPEKEQNESQLFPCIRKWTEARMGSRPSCSFMGKHLFT